ncbi:hypothetical protein A2U01_0017771 [Trifolium medium]|uniref:Uncharacterized protein n=1 Tax=Trifolium medium TaxID=97028 RepID=A0A392NAS3_9FABA|nr:hypothetical protein [Trifolium medium]
MTDFAQRHHEALQHCRRIIVPKGLEKLSSFFKADNLILIHGCAAG